MDKTQPTAFAICEDVKPQIGKPALIHGPYMISPDGLHKAYATVEVQVPDSGHKDEYDCRNHSTLFAGKGSNSQFAPVLDVAGADNPTRGNGLQLVDWSSDSDTLLADLMTWRYGSDAIEHNLVLYSSRTGVVRQKPLSSVFRSVSNQDCFFDGQIMGFLVDGRIAVRATAIGEEGIVSCVERTGFWALDVSDFKLRQISGERVVKHNGHFEESK